MLPPGIAASKKKGIHFAFCKYCNIDFSISHGGFNDVTRHVDNQTHKKNARVVAGNTSLESLGPVVRDSLATKVITAEIAVSLGDLIISITNMLCWKSFCPCGNSSKTRNKNDRKNVEHLDEGREVFDDSLDEGIPKKMVGVRNRAKYSAK